MDGVSVKDAMEFGIRRAGRKDSAAGEFFICEDMVSNYLEIGQIAGSFSFSFFRSKQPPSI